MLSGAAALYAKEIVPPAVSAVPYEDNTGPLMETGEAGSVEGVKPGGGRFNLG